jgi:hypothetical protein
VNNSNEKIKCPLCGMEFMEEDAQQSCKLKCIKKSFGNCASCNNLTCPNCGYGIPKMTRTGSYLSKLFSHD